MVELGAKITGIVDATQDNPLIEKTRIRRFGIPAAIGVAQLAVGFVAGAVVGALAGAALGALLGLLFGGSVEAVRTAAGVAIIGIVIGAVSGVVTAVFRMARVAFGYLVAAETTIIGAVVGGFLGGMQGAGIFGAVGAVTGLLFIIALRFLKRRQPDPTPEPQPQPEPEPEAIEA